MAIILLLTLASDGFAQKLIRNGRDPQTDAFVRETDMAFIASGMVTATGVAARQGGGATGLVFSVKKGDTFSIRRENPVEIWLANGDTVRLKSITENVAVPENYSFKAVATYLVPAELLAALMKQPITGLVFTTAGGKFIRFEHIREKNADAIRRCLLLVQDPEKE